MSNQTNLNSLPWFSLHVMSLILLTNLHLSGSIRLHVWNDIIFCSETKTAIRSARGILFMINNGHVITIQFFPIGFWTNVFDQSLRV